MRIQEIIAKFRYKYVFLMVCVLFSTSSIAYPQGVINLPQTGQTKCYDSLWGLPINCSGTGQDGDVRAGFAWPEPRFIVGGDCVTDNLTGLMWAKNASIPNWNMGWYDSLNFANDLSLCGYTDWRLPNIIELESLINYGEPDFRNTWLMEQAFRTVQQRYWSSTLSYNFNFDDPELCPGYSWNSSNILYVDFDQNSIFSEKYDDYDQGVWPVRDGRLPSTIKLPKTGQTTSCAVGDDGDLQLGIAWPEPRFIVGGDCVTDNLTGLMWAKDANLIHGKGDFQEALDYSN